MRIGQMLAKVSLVLAVLVAGTYPLAAADGVLEINQAGVEQAGGFPFTITDPGSYILTGNLEPGGVTAIQIMDAGDVTIDLNGFTIGSGDPKSAAGSLPKGDSGAVGIEADSSSRVSIFNGKIVGFNCAISLEGSGNEIKQVTVSGNEVGLRLGEVPPFVLAEAPEEVVKSLAKGRSKGMPGLFEFSTIVEDCVATRNGAGIIGSGVNITGTVVSQNEEGIGCLDCTLSDSVVEENGLGVLCGDCTMTNNRISGNVVYGVVAFASLFTGNTVFADYEDDDGPALVFPAHDVGWSNNVITDAGIFDKASGLVPGKAVRLSTTQAKGFPGIYGVPMGCNVINNILFCVYPEIEFAIENDF